MLSLEKRVVKICASKKRISVEGSRKDVRVRSDPELRAGIPNQYEKKGKTALMLLTEY